MAKLTGKELRRIMQDTLNEGALEFEGSYVIEKIEGAIDHYKNVADEATQKVMKLERAWSAWDFDFLVGVGVITQSDADFLQKIDEEEIADDYDLNPDVYEALRDRKVSLTELRPLTTIGSWIVPESLAKKGDKVIRESFWKKNRGKKMVVGISAIGKGKDGNTHVYYDEVKKENK